MMLIIPLTSSLEINKVNLFPAWTSHLPLISISNLFIAFIAFEAKLLTNPDKLSLAKGIATFASVFSCLNYLTKNQKIHLIELF